MGPLPLIEDVDLVEDSIPGDVVGVEYPCQECGKEAGPYSGRGRKPKFCEDCKAKRTGGTAKASGPKTVSGKNKMLAAQAADTLAQYNSIVALFASFTPFPNTGDAITNANEVFREQAYNALLTDPKLAAQISSGGSISGPALLVIAYLSLAAVVAPVAVVEFRANKARKEIDSER